MSNTENLPAIVDPAYGVDTYRTATNAATLCGEIVKATAQNIQGRKYVKVEGWMALAAAHGCLVSISKVESVEGGIRAIAELKRMVDGLVLATAEGFVGDDEPMWQKRPLYARRAMAQTRASSRVCRSAFSHCVVLIDRDLGTTPAEEMQGVIDNGGHIDQPRNDDQPTNKPRAKNSSAHGRSLAADEPDLIDHDREKGTMHKRGDEAAEMERKRRNAESWTEKMVLKLNEEEFSIEALNEWREKHRESLDLMQRNTPEPFDKLMTAFNYAIERAGSWRAA